MVAQQEPVRCTLCTAPGWPKGCVRQLLHAARCDAVSNARLPLLGHDRRYKLRVLFDAIDMRWDWPVDANYHEAKAFCAWRTELDGQAVRYRIITEGEHNLIRNTHDRVDAWRFAQPAQGGPADGKGGLGNGAERSPAAVSAELNPDLAMLAGGMDAEAK